MDGQPRSEDLRLVSAALDGDTAALERVDALLRAEVDAAAKTVRAPTGLGDEVLQRLRETLVVGTAERGPALRDYAGHGELRGFLRVSAVRECLRLLKMQRREVGMEAEDLAQLVPAADPELDRLKQTYRNEFASCFAEALASLEARERTILRMNSIDRLSIDEIGSVYAVHRATAARWLERARLAVAEKTEQLLAERLALTTGEVASDPAGSQRARRQPGTAAALTIFGGLAVLLAELVRVTEVGAIFIEGEPKLRCASGRDVDGRADGFRRAATVCVDGPMTGRDAGNPEGPIGSGPRELAIRQDENRRGHLRMDVAIDVDDADARKLLGLGLAARILPEVEFPDRRNRKDVVKERIPVGE
jgi:RNA polymerase sigma-70 factor (ECF subfamily)